MISSYRYRDTKKLRLITVVLPCYYRTLRYSPKRSASGRRRIFITKYSLLLFSPLLRIVDVSILTYHNSIVQCHDFGHVHSSNVPLCTQIKQVTNQLVSQAFLLQGSSLGLYKGRTGQGELLVRNRDTVKRTSLGRQELIPNLEEFLLRGSHVRKVINLLFLIGTNMVREE